MRVYLVVLCFSLLIGCSPNTSPDKTVAGAMLGAGWGAGAGAVVGNQVNATGEGAAIGAGFGMVSGMMTGIGLDTIESAEVRHRRELDALRVHTASNQRRLASLQDQLDNRERKLSMFPTEAIVYFDEGRASLQLGSAQELQYFAEKIKNNPFGTRVEVHGHASAGGEGKSDIELSEARARSVATFLAGQGVPLDRMKLVAHGSSNPIVAKTQLDGLALNRRVQVVIKK